jgi:hypothetical protein
MGASDKTLSRIMSLVDGNSLPIGARIAELGTQNLHCGPQSAIQFLRFFEQRGAKVSMAETDAAGVASGGQLGHLLRGVGFDYTAFDIFEAPDTKVMDLNIQIVPADLQGGAVRNAVGIW